MLDDMHANMREVSGVDRTLSQQQGGSTPVVLDTTNFENADAFYEPAQNVLEDLSFTACSPRAPAMRPTYRLRDEEVEDDESCDGLLESVSNSHVDHVMATDSYGKLR